MKKIKEECDKIYLKRFAKPEEVAKIQTLLNQAKLPTTLDKKVNANDLQ